MQWYHPSRGIHFPGAPPETLPKHLQGSEMTLGPFYVIILGTLRGHPLLHTVWLKADPPPQTDKILDKYVHPIALKALLLYKYYT